MPDVPIETPSETSSVLNSIGVPPASRTPRFTWTARSRWLRLHGIVSIQVVPTPTIGFARSSSVKPTAFSIARAPARSGPSVIAAEWRLAGSDGRSTSGMGSCLHGRDGWWGVRGYRCQRTALRGVSGRSADALSGVDRAGPADRDPEGVGYF